MYEACINSDHPSVHFCKKLPKKGLARKTHRKLNNLWKRLKKRDKKRKSQKKNRKGKKHSGKRKRGGRKFGKEKTKRNNVNRARVRARGAKASHVVETLEI